MVARRILRVDIILLMLIVVVFLSSRCFRVRWATPLVIQSSSPESVVV